MAGKGSGPLQVPCCEPVGCRLYLAPGSGELRVCDKGLPPRPEGCVRVVCISDTHNEHEGIRLPEGDILVHAGDVLTESGMRHVHRAPGSRPDRPIKGVHSDGVALLENFARWFGSLRFAHKVLVAGNHDLVLQGLGSQEVQAILSKHCAHGEAVYLERREAQVGPVRIFGSPYAHYTSHNDAFWCERPSYDIQPGVHIVVTHMPAVLPMRSGGKRGQLRPLAQHSDIAEPALKAGALLHVGGHCHWAHGLYFAAPSPLGPCWPGPAAAEQLPPAGEGGHGEASGSIGARRMPCVVASVSGSTWLFKEDLSSASGQRGDAKDKQHGGYNLLNPGIVCDIRLPDKPDLLSPPTGANSHAELTSEGALASLPAMLFFCPSNDAALVKKLLPRLQHHFHVTHVESAAEGVRAVQEQQFAACAAKLGIRGNLGRDVIAELRVVQGREVGIAIHSTTAAHDENLRSKLDEEFGIDLFTQHGCEHELLQYLTSLAGRVSASVPLPPPPLPPSLLFFCPPNDPGLAESLLPRLQRSFHVTHVESAASGVQAVSEQRFVACVAKLGTKGNLGRDVVAALRSSQGAEVCVVIHSATAAGNEKMRARLNEELCINLFTEHGREAELLAYLAPLAAGKARGTGGRGGGA